MPAPGQRDPAKEQYWRDMISKWNASGLSKTAFCNAEGVKVALFCSWETVIRRRDIERTLEERREKRQARQKRGERSKGEKSKSRHLKAREDYWRNALSRFAKSGRSKEQFCAKEGLFLPTFSFRGVASDDC